MNVKSPAVVQKLIRATTEDELSDAARTGLDRILDADQVAVLSAVDCTGDAQAWASTESLDIPEQRPLLSGIIGQSYTTRESVIVDDLLQTRSASAQSGSTDPRRYRSLLCVPVPEWGALVAVAHDAAAFSDEDRKEVELLRAFITTAATRIQTSNANHEAEDRLQEVTSILAHDIKSPLTTANGHLELAREEHESEHLEQVATALDRLEELVDDVVMLGQSGERLDTTESVDIREIATQVWNVINTHEADLTIEDSPTIHADESRLFQLFENLFRNAVTHGGFTVTVRVGALTDNAGFFVEDTGPGIPTADRDAVFEHGYSSEAHGTGLGLFIVENIIDAHGWEITVTESAQGGARFEMTNIESPQ